MEENAFPLMSFQGVDRYFSSVGKSDKALEHRRWLEFGLGTDAKRFAPIRQGEGVSRASSQAAYPSFPPKGEKLAHSAAPPFPTEPTSLGFGGDPVLELGDSKGQRVLWRVFLCYLSSREERWHALTAAQSAAGGNALGVSPKGAPL